MQFMQVSTGKKGVRDSSGGAPTRIRHWPANRADHQIPSTVTHNRTGYISARRRAFNNDAGYRAY